MYRFTDILFVSRPLFEGRINVSVHPIKEYIKESLELNFQFHMRFCGTFGAGTRRVFVRWTCSVGTATDGIFWRDGSISNEGTKEDEYSPDHFFSLCESLAKIGSSDVHLVSSVS